MRFTLQIACTAVALTIPIIGCTSSLAVRSQEDRQNVHAIFNPADSPVALTNFDRVDWPVAYLGDPATEEIQYREHFVDIQGRGFAHDDGFLFRRFESDRFGRSRR
jgi:hypothetical protein